MSIDGSKITNTYVEYAVYWPEHANLNEFWPEWVQELRVGATREDAARVAKRGINAPVDRREWPPHGIVVSREISETNWMRA